ncbi:branched-chain amino acid ABC transporter permease [uncultured Thiothrix sp.]|uniref:branched-chain amino acid ABC transporter permease n=1 Tax=uncultured Thiothrix sp. TaxID=223185 RepID=UPI002619D2F8|nr:branched-chain amino acid ABC transporter permease [uncultured Thiothrix sp.]
MMLFTEAGQLATSYKAEQKLFRLRQDYVAFGILLFLAFVALPYWGSDYWFNAILIPFLVLSLAGLGLNLLTGYAGQLSLGSAAFMAVGAFATYNLELRIPDLPLLFSILGGGLFAAASSVIFGLPSARIKGFYLIVSTLAAQFFIQWLFTKFSWFSNGSTSGVITAPPLVMAGYDFSTPVGRYLLTLSIVASLFLIARNLVRSELGRHWMAVRDRDTAAAVMGIPILKTKLLAFGMSGFILGIAGALWAFTYLGTVEPHGFDLTRSFQILFIIIIGGMGSLLGNFLGAAFIVLLPILLSQLIGLLPANHWVDIGQLENAQKIIFGGLIIFFLIKEPDGLARLWQRCRERARIWPLRY